MIPLCFKGETVVVIASGASLTPEDVDYCRGKAKVAVVNDNYKLAPWADLLYAADRGWWEHHWDSVKDLPMQKWTQDDYTADLRGINHIKGHWKPGISHDKEFIHYGFNSGFQCVNLVYLMGAKCIILLGFDMQKTDKKTHWFGDHPGELNKHSKYSDWADKMDKAARRYAKAGIEVINATRETALREYERRKITDCL